MSTICSYFGSSTNWQKAKQKGCAQSDKGTTIEAMGDKNPIAQAMKAICMAAEANEEENESEILKAELEETHDTLQQVKEEEQRYKGCLPTSKQGTVFRINIPEAGFICARIQMECPPIIVRGGRFQQEVVFDESTGKASWEERDKAYVLKHSRDLASHLKLGEWKEHLLQKEKDIKAEIAIRKEKLKELRRAHEEVLEAEEAEMEAANAAEAKAQAATKQKLVAQLEKVCKAMTSMSIEGKSAKEKKAMALVEKTIEEIKEPLETPGSSSSSGKEAELTKKSKTRSKWAKRLAEKLVKKRVMKPKDAKPKKKSKN